MILEADETVVTPETLNSAGLYREGLIWKAFPGVD